MSKSGYRDLEVWQKARVLASRIYAVTQQFPKSELFGLTSQLRRATISVASNIAEGHGRRSAAERIQFLTMARGSLFEIETQVTVSADLEFIKAAEAEDLLARTTETARLLNGLIRHYTRPPR